MKLKKLIDADHLFLDLEAASAEQALREVADRATSELGIAAEVIADALLERERLGSTSVGDGFAIPHCKLHHLDSIWVALARFTSGIEFGAADGVPVVFFWVVLSPPDQPAAHLQVLSQIARVLKRRELRQQLLDAPDCEHVLKAMDETARLEGL